jgi:hypothetical protein
MSETILETLELDVPAYEKPDNVFELAEREEDGKKLILYAGKMALLDILKKAENGVPDHLLLRIESSPDKAMDLFHHPALYTTPEMATIIFERAA